MSGSLGRSADLLELVDGRVRKQMNAAAETKAMVKSVDVQNYVARVVLQGDPDVTSSQVPAGFTPQNIPLIGDIVSVVNYGGKFRITRIGTSAGFSLIRDAKFPLQLGGANDIAWSGTALKWTIPFTYYDVNNSFQLPIRKYVRLTMPTVGKSYPFYGPAGTSGTTVWTSNGFAFTPGSRLYVQLDLDAIRDSYATVTTILAPDNYVVVADGFTDKLPDNMFLLAWFEAEVTARDDVGVGTYSLNNRWLRSGAQVPRDYRDTTFQYSLPAGIAVLTTANNEKFTLNRVGDMRYLGGTLVNTSSNVWAVGATIATLLDPADAPPNGGAWGTATILSTTNTFSSITGARLSGMDLLLSATVAASNGRANIRLQWRVGI